MKAAGLTKETVLQEGVHSRNFPEFRVGDTIVVSQIVKEGAKERIQKFQGDVIADHNNGIASTFTVRRLCANNIYVERIYPYYSPMIDGIEVMKRGRVRRAKLFYLRDRVGKAAKIKEKVLTKEQKKQLNAKKSSN